MRGMILAAGRGLRMGSLTDHTPKPLLKVGNRFLIEYSLQAFISAGIHDIVINVSYLREQIKDALGDGKKYGVNIYYSEEEEALETGGGIFQALPLLGNEPFVVLSADVITDYSLKRLPKKMEGLAHLVLVKSPDFNLKGDFNLDGNYVTVEPRCALTYANIGLFHPNLFAECKAGKFKLGDVLKDYAKRRLVTGECFMGSWANMGTVEQLNHHPQNYNPYFPHPPGLPYVKSNDGLS